MTKPESRGLFHLRDGRRVEFFASRSTVFGRRAGEILFSLFILLAAAIVCVFVRPRRVSTAPLMVRRGAPVLSVVAHRKIGM